MTCKWSAHKIRPVNKWVIEPPNLFFCVRTFHTFSKPFCCFLHNGRGLNRVHSRLFDLVLKDKGKLNFSRLRFQSNKMARTFFSLFYFNWASQESLCLSRAELHNRSVKKRKSLQRAWRIIMRRLMNSTRLVVSVSVSHKWQRRGGLLAYESKCERWPNIICECFTSSVRDRERRRRVASASPCFSDQTLILMSCNH